MASNVSTVDGMGFEEVNQSSFTETISGTNIYASNSVTTEGVLAGSFLGNFAAITDIYGTGSIIDNRGRLRSSLLGSATTNVWGAFIQAGSLLTTTGNVGFVKFGTPFSSATSYYVTASPCGSATSFENWYISGTRNASGVNFVGAASLRYDWQAVGL